MGMFAKAKADMAKEQEIMASAQEKLAKVEELEASADHKKAQTEFDLVKSMLELESMDLEMIHRSYEIAMAIKGQNTSTNQEASQQLSAQAV